jgi:hypothetical protein
MDADFVTSALAAFQMANADTSKSIAGEGGFHCQHP